MRELQFGEGLVADAAAAASAPAVEPGAVEEAEARRLLAFAADTYRSAGEDGPEEQFLELREAGIREAHLAAAEAQAQASLAVVELLRELLRRVPPGAGS